MENLGVMMEVFQFGEKNNLQKTKIIAAFAGTGKTYCAKKHENVLDFDYLFLKFSYEDELLKTKKFEELKGIKKGRSLNPQWPQNFITQLFENMQKYDVILIPANDEILSYLEENKLDYILCYPKVECKSIYMKRYLDRGTNQEWIQNMDKNFEEYVNGFDLLKCKKMILEQDETLEDKLIEMNYIKKL